MLTSMGTHGEVNRRQAVVIERMVVSLAGSQVRRSALLDRVARVRPRILALIAPAGFGKSTFARQLVTGQTVAICDAAGIGDDLDFARRLLPALATEEPGRTQALTQSELMLGDAGTAVGDRVNLALEAWKTAVSPSTFVFENAEHIARNAAAREFFARLLTQGGGERAIVICSRENLRVHLTRFASPHEILTLRAADLAFDRSELATLFYSAQADETTLARIMQLSQGWPIAVFLLKRFANEGRITELLERLGDVAFDELHDYLADQVLASLSQELVNALFACACIPGARAVDLRAALPADCGLHELQEFARESPFVTRSAAGEFVVHPLLASLLTDRREEDRIALLSSVAKLHEEHERFQRSAELLLAAGDLPAAARVLGRHEVFQDATPSMAYARVLSSLDRSLVQRYPRLWAMTALLRSFCVDPEELLDEAESLWRTLSPESTAIERYYLLAFRVLFMSHLGMLDEASEVLDRFAADYGLGTEPKTYFEGCFFYLAGLIHARLGRLSRAERDLTSAITFAGTMDAMNSSALLCLGSDVAQVRGEFALAKQFRERALDAARRSGLPNVIALNLAESALAGWLTGDSAFSGFVAELEQIVQRSGVRAFAYFSAALSAQSAVPGDADMLKWVACGQIVEAANAPNAMQAIKHAKAALDAAQQYRAPFVECLAAIALAVFDDLHFEAHMERAIAAAERCDSPKLVASTYAVADRRQDCGMLAGFLDRLGPRVQDRAQTQVLIASGTVLCRGSAVPLPERELALLIALSLRRGVVPRGRLAELLWPELDEYAARNALSVCLHRLRQHLGNEGTIARTTDGYALSDDVRVDLWEIDRTVSVLRSRPALSDADRVRLQQVHEQLQQRRPQRMLQWEWFGSTERRIGELRLEVAARLAKDALNHGDPHAALALAEEMIGYDACDETARHVAITAHLAIGDRSAALRHYRQYRRILATELQVEPSCEIKQLVGLP